MTILTKTSKFLFGETVKIQNVFLGEMLYAESYYECRRPFKRINSILEIGQKRNKKIFSILLKTIMNSFLKKLVPQLKKV